MAKSVHNDNVLNDVAPDMEVRPDTNLMALPDDLAEWAHENQDLILRVQSALTNTYDMLSEDQLWDTIAATSSEEWLAARTTMHDAEGKWAELNSPANAPLGPIGSALDSDETTAAHERYTISLSHYTIINEGLRQRPDLSMLYRVLLVQKRMTDLSQEYTINVKTATDELGHMLEAPETSTRHEGSGLRAKFASFAQKLLPKTEAAPKPERAPTTAPVPWSPKTGF